jgi:hypothetical protein
MPLHTGQIYPGIKNMAEQLLKPRAVLIWTLVIPLASCAKSTLKVAVCNPGQVPYATVQDDGTLTGYDVGNSLFSSHIPFSCVESDLMTSTPSFPEPKFKSCIAMQTFEVFKKFNNRCRLF